MSQLTGISSFCGESNLSGYRTLKYLPIDALQGDDYEELISADGYFKKQIVPSAGSWLTLPYLITGQEGWKQGHDKNLHGDRFKQTIGGLMVKMRPEVEAEFAEMDRRLFLVHLTDQNGKDWLIGRKSEPLEFFASADTGSRDGLNSYRFRFEGVTSKRALGYSF